jgi:hypothetical protein
MAYAETDSKQSSGNPAWKMSEPCKAGACSECAAYFSDGAVYYRSGLRLSRMGNGR